MLRFEGDKDFRQAPADVWVKLSDARFLVQCVPGAEKVKESAQDHARFALRPGLSFLPGTMDVTLRVAEAVASELVRVLIHSKGIGTSSDIEAVLKLAPQDTGTRVHWIADLKNLGGLLKAAPQGLLKAAAQKAVEDVLQSVEKNLQS